MLLTGLPCGSTSLISHRVIIVLEGGVPRSVKNSVMEFFSEIFFSFQLTVINSELTLLVSINCHIKSAFRKKFRRLQTPNIHATYISS